MRLLNTFKQRCEAIATEQRAQLRLKAFDPLPAKVLAHHLNAELVRPEQITSASAEVIEYLLTHNDWSAGIYSLQPLKVLYNPQHLSARFESDIMHELAHFLLKHPMVGFDPITGLPQRNLQHEDEATYLGSCLQIPQRGLAWGLGKRWSLAQIAKHFGASDEMVLFRLNMTGIHS